jgi:hypothetical protein
MTSISPLLKEADKIDDQFSNFMEKLATTHVLIQQTSNRAATGVLKRQL